MISTLTWMPDEGTAAPDAASCGYLWAFDLCWQSQEQLGLKLEPTKGPMEILIIDNVERPSEN